MEIKPFSENIPGSITDYSNIDTFTALPKAIEANLKNAIKAIKWLAKTSGITLSFKALNTLAHGMMKIYMPIWNLQIANDIYKFWVSNPHAFSYELDFAQKQGFLKKKDVAKMKLSFLFMKETGIPYNLKHLTEPVQKYLVQNITKAKKGKSEKQAKIKMDIAQILKDKGISEQKAKRIAQKAMIIPFGEFYHRDVGWY